MTIKKQSFNETRVDKKERQRKPEDHRAEKHFRNALRSNNFADLTDEELDELGYGGESQDYWDSYDED